VEDAFPKRAPEPFSQAVERKGFVDAGIRLALEKGVNKEET